MMKIIGRENKTVERTETEAENTRVSSLMGSGEHLRSEWQLEGQKVDVIWKNIKSFVKENQSRKIHKPD